MKQRLALLLLLPAALAACASTQPLTITAGSTVCTAATLAECAAMEKVAAAMRSPAFESQPGLREAIKADRARYGVRP